MAPRSAEATQAMSRPATSVGSARRRAMNSEPGSAASANRIMGRPERMPTSVPERRKSDWISAMTGGTARMLSRSATPASHSRPPAIQSSRMALPAAASAALKHASAAYSVPSPPPCGEGLGVGVHQRITARTPTPALRADPPHKGEGKERVCRWRLFLSTRIDSGRPLQAIERLVDLEPPRLGFFALLALALDHIFWRAGDEIGIGELGIDAGNVGFDPRHPLLQPRFLGGKIDPPLERQRRDLAAHDQLHGALRHVLGERNLGEA